MRISGQEEQARFAGWSSRLELCTGVAGWNCRMEFQATKFYLKWIKISKLSFSGFGWVGWEAWWMETPLLPQVFLILKLCFALLFVLDLRIKLFPSLAAIG